MHENSGLGTKTDLHSKACEPLSKCRLMKKSLYDGLGFGIEREPNTRSWPLLMHTVMVIPLSGRGKLQRNVPFASSLPPVSSFMGRPIEAVYWSKHFYNTVIKYKN